MSIISLRVPLEQKRAIALRLARTAAGLTRAELGRRIGVVASTVKWYERYGRYGDDMIGAIARATNQAEEIFR